MYTPTYMLGCIINVASVICEDTYFRKRNVEKFQTIREPESFHNGNSFYDQYITNSGDKTLAADNVVFSIE